MQTAIHYFHFQNIRHSGDFTDDANQAMSFSMGNVIAMGNEAIKMAIKGCNFTAFFQNVTLRDAHISSCLEGRHWETLYLFKIKGLFNNKEDTDKLLWHILGPSIGPWGR